MSISKILILDRFQLFRSCFSWGQYFIFSFSRTEPKQFFRRSSNNLSPALLEVVPSNDNNKTKIYCEIDKSTTESSSSDTFDRGHMTSARTSDGIEQCPDRRKNLGITWSWEEIDIFSSYYWVPHFKNVNLIFILLRGHKLIFVVSRYLVLCMYEEYK